MQKLPSINNKVSPDTDALEKDEMFHDQDELDGEFVMPSLPMKFSFNRIYIGPRSDTIIFEQVNLSLKAIFSKNANDIQKKARRNFLLKVFGITLAFILVIAIAIAVAVSLASGPQSEATTTVPTTTKPASLVKIATSLVNDLAELDDSRMVSSGLDGFIHIWNVRTGLDTQKWSAATSPIKIICTKSGHLVTGSLSSEDALKLWNPNTSTLIDTGAGSKSINSLAIISDDGSEVKFAVGKDDSTITIWKIVSLKFNEFKTLTSPGGGILKLLLLSNGKLAAGTSDGLINIWDIDAETKTSYTASNLNEPVKALAQLSTSVLAAGADMISMWDFTQEFGSQIAIEGSNVGNFLDISKDIKSMVTLTNNTYAYGTDDNIEVIQYYFETDLGATTMKKVQNSTLKGHEANINALILLKDKRLVSGSLDGSIRFWSRKGGY